MYSVTSIKWIANHINMGMNKQISLFYISLHCDITTDVENATNIELNISVLITTTRLANTNITKL